MKEIQISNNQIFEFESSETIQKSTLNEILSSNLSWVTNVPFSDSIVNYSTNAYRDLGNNEITFFYHKPLFDWINECLELVTKKYFTNGTLKVCDSWVVKTTFGQAGPKHYHVPSMFSGLFYLTDHSSSETVFHYDDPVYNHFTPYYGDIVRKHSFTYSSQPKAGKLLIWPSYLPHHVNVHKDKITRYTISFNTELTGVIGPIRTGYCDRNVRTIDEQNSLGLSKLKPYRPG